MWVVFLILGLAILLAVVLLCIYIKYRRDYWKYMGLPHERPKGMLEIFKIVTGQQQLDEDKVQHYAQMYREHKGSGPFCGFYHLLRPRVLVLEIELIRQILIKDFSNFSDHGEYYNTKSDPLSGHLYNIAGDNWKEMRMRLNPAFKKHALAQIYDNLYMESHKLLLAFDMALQGQKSGSFMVKQHLSHFVLDCMARCVFGINEQLRPRYSLKQFSDMTLLALHSKRHGVNMHMLMRRYRATSRRLGLAITNATAEAYFLKLVQNVVEIREKIAHRNDDFMQMLIDIMNQELTTHESEHENDAKEIKQHLLQELAAHAFLFLKTGYEHTANTLSFVLYELAMNKQCQQQVRQELQQALQEHNDELNYDCIMQLKFMGQVISETVRMHPIHPYLIRRAFRRYVVPSYPKYIIGKDMYIIIPTHAIHNDPEYFPQPEVFNPDRFAGSENRMREQCVWLGFGEGPRSCIGVHFAQLLMRVALARLLMQYEFNLDMSRLIVKSEVALYVERLNVNENTEFRESLVI